MITYRKATLPDAQALARIRCTFLMEANDLSSEAQLAEMEPMLLAYFTTTLADGSFVAWLALDGDAIVATSGLSFSLVPPSYSNKSGKAAYIINMYTRPEYRRRGIAAALLKRTIEEAKTRGYSKITLHATDMGRPLYETFGFSGVPEFMELQA